MMTLKNDNLSQSLSKRNSSTTLDFVITDQQTKINCKLESLMHHEKEVYVLFRDMSDNLYAYLIVEPHSERPRLIEPTNEIQQMLINEYNRVK